MKKEEEGRKKGLRRNFNKKIREEKSSTSETDSLTETSWGSKEEYDLGISGEQDPVDPRKNKSVFRSHFDLINDKLQKLRIRQKKQ